jgi:hypothetical protein
MMLRNADWFSKVFTTLHVYGVMFTAALSSAAACGVVIPVYTLDGASNYLEMPIDADLYRYSNSVTLSDVSIVDARGESLPYRVVVENARESVVKQIPVRFFSIAVGEPPETLLIRSSASIRLSDNQITVDAEKAAPSNVTQPNESIDFYVVDLSDYRDPVDSLQIRWPQGTSTDLLTVRVEGTNDLSTWIPLTTAGLAQVEQGGQRLVKNSIRLNLPPQKYAYLRIKAKDRATTPFLSEISLTAVEHAENVNSVEGMMRGIKLATNTSAMKGAPDPTAVFEFARDDITPIEALSIDLQGASYSQELRVYSRSDTRLPWQRVYEGIWFNVHVGDQWHQSDAVSLGGAIHPYWRVELMGDVANDVIPVLDLRYRTQRLQFLASGHRPYELRIDTNAKVNFANPGDDVIRRVIGDTPVTWETASSIDLSPALDQFPRHQPTGYWRGVLFWGVLLLAVGVLIALSIKLLKQLPSTPAP